jgi:hypothetical protein
MPFIETTDVINIIKTQKEKNITSLISEYYQELNKKNKRFFYSSNNDNDDKLLPVLCSLFHDRNLTIEKILFEKNDFNIHNINLRRIYHSINDEDIDHELEQERHKGNSNSFLDKNELEIFKKENVLNIYKEIFKDNYIKEFNSNISIQSDYENFLILYDNNSNGNTIGNNFNSNINTNKIITGDRKDIKLDWKDNSCYIDTSLVSIFHDGYETFSNVLSGITDENKQDEYKQIFKVYELQRANNDVDINLFEIIKNLRKELLDIYNKIKEGSDDKFYVTELRILLRNYNTKIEELYTNTNTNDYKYQDNNNLLTEEGDPIQILNFIFNNILNPDKIKYYYNFINGVDINQISEKQEFKDDYDKIIIQTSINSTNIQTTTVKNIPQNLDNGLKLSSFIIQKGQNHFISYINYKDLWYEYNDTRNKNAEDKDYLKLIDLSNYENNILNYLYDLIENDNDYEIKGIVYSRDNYKDLNFKKIKPSSIVCTDKDDDKTVCLYKNNEKWYKYDCQNYKSYEIKDIDEVKEAEISNYKSPYYLIYK